MCLYCMVERLDTRQEVRISFSLSNHSRQWQLSWKRKLLLLPHRIGKVTQPVTTTKVDKPMDGMACQRWDRVYHSTVRALQHHQTSCPWGKESDQQCTCGEWGQDGTRDTGITGNWRRLNDSFLPRSLPLPLPESSPRLDQPARQPAQLALSPTPVVDPSVLAEMGDVCTNGTHPPEIQALSPSFTSSLRADKQCLVSGHHPLADSLSVQ